MGNVEGEFFKAKMDDKKVTKGNEIANSNEKQEHTKLKIETRFMVPITTKLGKSETYYGIGSL